MDEKNNRIKQIIEGALKNLDGLVDVDTVIGSPIKGFNEDIIIPVSKVTFGVLCGGGEYGKVTVFKNGSDLPYSAGNGSIVSIKPCGFLIKGKDSDYKILPIGDNAINNLIEKTSEYLSKITFGSENNE